MQQSAACLFLCWRADFLPLQPALVQLLVSQLASETLDCNKGLGCLYQFSPDRICVINFPSRYPFSRSHSSARVRLLLLVLHLSLVRCEQINQSTMQLFAFSASTFQEHSQGRQGTTGLWLLVIRFWWIWSHVLQHSCLAKRLCPELFEGKLQHLLSGLHVSQTLLQAS